jgi:hypothetical protein
MSIPDPSSFQKTPQISYKKFGDLPPNTVYYCSEVKDIKTRNGDAKRLTLSDPKDASNIFSLLINPDVYNRKLSYHHIRSAPFWFYFECVKRENNQNRNYWEPMAVPNVNTF